MLCYVIHVKINIKELKLKKEKKKKFIEIICELQLQGLNYVF